MIHLMDAIPLFPLSRALFPDGVLHLRIFEVRYLDMVRKCIANDSPFGVVVLLEGSEVRSPEGVETLASTGVLARIDDWRAPLPALMHIRCLGAERFRLTEKQKGQFGLWTGAIETIAQPSPLPVPPNLQAAANTLGRLIADMQKEGMPAAAMPLAPPFRLDECGWVADRWCELLPLAPEQAQDLLALDDAQERLRVVYDILKHQGLLR